MRAFICAYNFTRKVPVKKFIKPSEIPKKDINDPLIQDSNKNVMDEMQKLVNFICWFILYNTMLNISTKTSEFEGTKTMKLVDKVLDNYLKKDIIKRSIYQIFLQQNIGYNMDQLINIIQKGGIINDEIKKSFVNDAHKNVILFKYCKFYLSNYYFCYLQKEMIQQKNKIMEQQFEQIKTSNPELYNYINSYSKNENIEKGAPKYTHERKDKKQKQEQENKIIPKKK